MHWVRALSLRLPLSATAGDFVPVVVTDSEARTVQPAMHRLGYRYVVRRPVHPEALRTLLRQILNDDSGRRAARRVATGCPARWKQGWRWREGTVIDLSTESCQLLVREPVPVDSNVRIRIPGEVTGGKSISVSGRVVRRATLVGERRALGVQFDDVSQRMRDRLEKMIATVEGGPVRLAADPRRDDAAFERPV